MKGFPRRAQTATCFAFGLVALLATGALGHSNGDQNKSPAQPGQEMVLPSEPGSVLPAEKDRTAVFWLGRLHPAAVHFPIALLIAGAVSEFLLASTKRDLFRHSTRFLVWGGSLGAVLAALLGWLFAGFALVDEEWLLTAHRWTGTGLALWAVGLLPTCERASRQGGTRTGLRLGLAAGACGVTAAGFFGGSLVHGIDHLAW